MWCRLIIFIVFLLPSMTMAQTELLRPTPADPSFDLSKLSDREIIDLLQQIESRQKYPQHTAILGIPSGFGASRGLVFVSGTATNRRERRRLGDWDASLAAGFGLGDARRGIGVTTIINITSVSPFHFGSSGHIGLQFSRQFTLGTKWQAATSLGLQNLISWGDSKVLDPEWNLTFSGIRPADDLLGLPIQISAGYGSAVSQFGTDKGFYGGIGVGLGNNFGISLGWYGDEAILGANLWPTRRKNLLINLGFGDILDNESGRRLLLSATFVKQFSRSK